MAISGLETKEETLTASASCLLTAAPQAGRWPFWPLFQPETSAQPSILISAGTSQPPGPSLAWLPVSQDDLPVSISVTRSGLRVHSVNITY